MKPSIVPLTVVFGVMVGAIVAALGYCLMGLDAWTALTIGGLLGLAQSAGGLFYIRRRFKYQGRSPRDGGMPG